MSEHQRSKSVTKIKQYMKEQANPLTLKDIAVALPELKTSQISMTLCYLLANRYVKRDKIDTNGTQRRKQVWQYQYSETKFPAEVSNAN